MIASSHPAPHPVLQQLVAALAPLGDCIVVTRGTEASANLLGSFRLDRDGADPWAVRMNGCTCHVHLDWSRVASFDVAFDDVGYGAEPCVILVDAAGAPLLRLYYPTEAGDRLIAALRELARR